MPVALIIVAAVVAVPAILGLGWLVHCALNRFCISLGERHCRGRGLAVVRSRAGIAVEPSGVKTEFTIVELDCLDAHRERRLVRLLVWLFGVRTILTDESYPPSHDKSWPQASLQP